MRRGAVRTAVLLDRHPLWLAGVRDVLERGQVHVVAETTTVADAVAAVDEHRPDILVCDVALGPDENTIGGIRKARALVRDLRVIVLSGQEDSRRIDEAFAAGAIAYVVKTVQPDDITLAVRQSFDYSIFLSKPSGGAVGERDPADELAGLTRRELEILRLVAEGSSNEAVAKALWVTEQTVKFHLSNIYRKLGVSNRTEASRRAQLAGLLAAPSDDARVSDPR